jgi:membrane-associated phospholipid phosphatase
VQLPFDPAAGTWKPWVLSGGAALRLGAPPALGSPTFQRDLEELRTLSRGARTAEQANIARYWATEAPSTRWELFLDDELRLRRWSAPHAARARAYVSVAMYDAFIACWDSKYTYWLARPVTVDASLTTVFSTPPFPSYPSGHSTISTAAAVVLGELFPSRAAEYLHRAEEASNSRVYGGVHYRFDVVDGDSLGARVGRLVARRMRTL